jgi:hypothetical protein
MRHVTFTTRSLLASTVLVGSLTVTGVALAARAGSAPATTPSPVPVLVEVPVCWGSSATGATLPVVDGGMVQTVTVSVEPTSLLKLDADGHVNAAETNTGCAPRSTDRLFVVHDDGSLTDATGFDVASVAWTGDFTQFGFVSQRHG